MKITDIELNIKYIQNVQKGRIAPSSPKCNSRHSDCFVYVLSGEAEYIFANKSYIAKADDIVYLSHKSKYLINVTDENYTFIYVDFFFEDSENTVFNNEIYRSKCLSVYKNDFVKLYNFWRIGDFSKKIYCKSLIYKIYSELAMLNLSQYITLNQREQIENIATYINNNLSDSNLTVSHLSKMCNISEVHFRRIFSNIYHVSPIKFISLLRINKAKELLLLGNYQISEVAEQCGYQNQYYFSKVFKADTNMTPSQFRNFYKTNI